MTTPAYSQRQIMLSLAYLAYTDASLTTGTPTLDAQIGTDLANAMAADAPNPIPPIAGQWSIVWGPVSYTVPGALHQDNMMYVAALTGAAPAQYAIAIRGTNGAVELDWLLEDFDVMQMMPWPVGATGTNVVGNISESTNIALNVLLTMQDSNSLTLLQFLENDLSATNTPSVGVCVTGHSLGAALASTLALYLRDNQDAWDPNAVAIVTTITFAGPSQGDANFAAYFNQKFAYSGTSSLPYWVPPDASAPSYADCVRCSLDIVPLAWNTTTLNTIPTIYEGHGLSNIYAPLGTTEVIGLITKVLAANNYTQVEAQQAPLVGQFQEKDTLQPVGKDDYFIPEVAYQHSKSYPTLLDVPSLIGSVPGTALFD